MARRSVTVMTTLALRLDHCINPVLSPLLAAAFRNLAPAIAFSLWLPRQQSTERGRESGLSQRAKEGLLLAQLSDLQHQMTRPELLPRQK